MAEQVRSIKRVRAWADLDELDARLAMMSGGRTDSVAVPVRVTRSVVLPELSDRADATANVAGLTAEWFEIDADFALGPGTELDPLALVDPAAAEVIVEEVVVRGAEWLEARWRDGGPRWKHVALGRRAPGVPAGEVSPRWRSHAGQVGGQVIPEVARGQAYVQDHPVRPGVGPWDAVTEVWFDRLDDLRARIEWFALPRPPDDLFAEPVLLAVREEPVDPRALR